MKEKKKQSKRKEYAEKEMKEAFEDIQVKEQLEENQIKWNTVEGALLRSQDPKLFYFQFNQMQKNNWHTRNRK